MSECVIVVWRLVPYHDARFSAAVQKTDFTVIEVFGQDKELAWSDRISRAFKYISLTKGEQVDTNSAYLFGCLSKQLDELAPKTVVIQGWSDRAAYTTADWALKNNAKIIIFSESNSYDHPRLAWREWPKKRILDVCDAAFVGGRDHVSYLVDLGFDKKRIALGYNVVDNDHFIPSTETEASDDMLPQAPYFLVVSRLVEGKNLYRTIMAFADYRSRLKSNQWDLVILGVGPLEKHLRNLVRDLRVEEHVRLNGFRKYDELPNIYHQAGALVHTSTEEPWGLVVNEAMSSGLPVIVSNKCGCCCELVNHGVNGFAIEPEDAESITQRMLAMSDGTVDRKSFGENSLRIISDWGPTRFANGFHEAFELAQSSSSKSSMLSRLVVWVFAQRR